ncbi:cytochrome c3 family protein [Seleniivibrio sp.]|uniref:cytochrome c3 family protein n=1 Tax=Seleniivibrio sp. TaxID=2898801 RepID=UPI0025F9E639|nr:cytochrome c3 family protein [Seleniivibrio sp.]MCD8554769.1 cytochrome c3 family protein [Seleniivibrio sp.]
MKQISRKIISMIFVICIVPVIAFAAAQNNELLAQKHLKQGVACTDCHAIGEEKAPVKVDTCLSCHDGYEGMAKKTEKKGDGTYLSNLNPHKSHLGNVECTECHKGHEKAATTTCEKRCHTFGLVLP